MAPQKRKTAAQPSKLKLFYGVLGLVALIGIGALVFAVTGMGSGQAATELVPLEGVDDPQALVARADGMVAGDPSAPVKVLEFGDFQCPGCGQFSQRVEPMLELNYIKTGKIQFVFYDYPLVEIHQNTFLASRAARCAADQGNFWDYHDLLFGRQSRWAFNNDPASEFIAYAEELGLDAGEFESCLNSDRFADVVTANRRLGEQLGVHATPTLIVNGRRVGNPLDYDELSSLIDQELGG